MGNHGVWADDEISCISINGLQLFITHTSTGCALKVGFTKTLLKQCMYKKYIHTTLPCGHYAHTQYTGSREIHVPGYVCLLDILKTGARREPFSNGLSSSNSNLVVVKAAV